MSVAQVLCVSGHVNEALACGRVVRCGEGESDGACALAVKTFRVSARGERDGGFRERDARASVEEPLGLAIGSNRHTEVCFPRSQ